MTNFDDRFSGGGGGGFFLGINPPKSSAEFTITQNTSGANNAGGVSQNFTDKARNLPVSDTIYAALTLPVLSSASGNSHARGQLPDTSADWALTSGSIPLSQSVFARAYWYDKTNNNYYFLGTTSGLQIQTIVKVDASSSGPSASILHDFTGTPISTNSTVSNGNVLFPDDPSDPDNADWTILHTDNSTPMMHQVSIVNSSSAVTSTTNFKVDSGGTNQDVDSTGGYVTEDKTLIVGSWGFLFYGSDGRTVGTFIINRGPSKHRVIYEIDGVIPFINSFQDVEGSGAANASNLITLWGDSTVAFMADGTTDALTSFDFCYGRRLLDRVDFDRWLQEVADFYNMPPGEAYY